MSDKQKVNDYFVNAFGPPDEPAVPLQFSETFLEENWLWRQQRTGAGWFLGRFFFLLGEGLDRFNPCLEAWSFLLSPLEAERRIIGYNACGSLLILENENERSVMAPVRLLDTTNVEYWGTSECVYGTLLNYWLPDRTMPYFLDTSVYEHWLKTSGRFLADDEILGIRAALPLGGELKLDNFTPINIIDYYRSTGPVYAKAHKQHKSGQ